MKTLQQQTPGAKTVQRAQPMNAMQQAQGMNGMEHPEDTIFVPPLVDERILSRFERALRMHAQATNVESEMAEKLRDLRTRLEGLVNLASLCRLAVLGEPHALARVTDELQCLVVDYPDSLPDLPASEYSNGSPHDDGRFAAAFDLLAGAAFAAQAPSKGLESSVVAIVRALESAVAYPLAFADATAAYLNEGDGAVSPKQARIAVANAAERILASDLHCDPGAPAWFRQRLGRLARRWLEGNPVTLLLGALTDPGLAGASVCPESARVGELVTLEWGADVQDPSSVVAVFSPHQPAKVLGAFARRMQVEVPEGARSGTIAIVRKPDLKDLDEISELAKRYEDAYGPDWTASVFGTIPLGQWAYAAAFRGAPCVEVTQPPRSVSAEVFDSAGRRAEAKTFTVGDELTIRYRVTPAGSDTDSPPRIIATCGSVVTAEPGTLKYRPDEPGLGSVRIEWPTCGVTVPVKVSVAWRLAAARAFIARSSPTATFEIRVDRSLPADVSFELASVTGRSAVAKAAVLRKGSRSVTVQVESRVKDAGPLVGKAWDLIDVSLDGVRRRIEIWLIEPQGVWDAPIDGAGSLAIVGVHAVVLRTGKVLYFSFDARAVNNKDNFNKYFADPNLGSYQIWDPLSESAGPVQPIGRNIFCAGQCQLADGTIFTAGGQDGAGAADVTGAWDKLFSAWFGSDNGAHKDVHTYDPVADTWMRWPDLDEGRYYPTVQTLGDGSAFVAGGLSNLQTFVLSGDNWCQNDQYEIYPGGALVLGASVRRTFRSADQYPILRLLPGTRHLFTHIHDTTYLFDLNSGNFIPGAVFMPPSPVGRQTYPMQTGYVLLAQREGDAPRILVVGGSTHSNFDYNTQSDAPAVGQGFIFEYNTGNPTSSRWRATAGALNTPRLLSDTVLLPDGTVFVVNGIGLGAASGHSSDTVFVTELFDPVTETFARMADSDHAHPRAYHSTAVLLPDARVAIAGNTGAYNNPDGNGVAPFDDTTIQIFNPPYLFRGPRPVVSGVPASMDYAESATVNATGAPISRIMLMRPCAVTHSQDMDQRAIWLATGGNPSGGDATRGTSTITFAMPKDASLAPPGYYMMFFLSPDGVPSIASWVRLGRADSASGSDPGDGGDGGAQSYPPVNLGTYENNANVSSVYDGDITIEKIDQHCNVQLESRYGSITINQKCDQHCTVVLKAKTTVFIGQKIDQHCNVTITCESDVTIGQKIDGNSEATIATSNGSIFIGQKIDGNSSATLKAPNGHINIIEKIDGGSVVQWHALSLQCPDTGGGTVIPI